MRSHESRPRSRSSRLLFIYAVVCVSNSVTVALSLSRVSTSNFRTFSRGNVGSKASRDCLRQALLARTDVASRSDDKRTLSTSPLFSTIASTEHATYQRDFPYHLPPAAEYDREIDFTQRDTIASVASWIPNAVDGASVAVKQWWWCFPMLLALYPLWHAVVTGTAATVPSWWAVQKMDHLFIHSSGRVVASVGGFLLSNVAYILSGLYLLNIIPSPVSVGATSPDGISGRRRRTFFCEHPLLGISLLVSGIVSATYHTVQTLGSYAAAEAMCYVDHGVAVTAGLYFLRTCGIPRFATLSIGTMGLAALAAPGTETYPLLHSLWHFVSSAAAVSWANDGASRWRRLRLERIRFPVQ